MKTTNTDQVRHLKQTMLDENTNATLSVYTDITT